MFNKFNKFLFISSLIALVCISGNATAQDIKNSVAFRFLLNVNFVNQLGDLTMADAGSELSYFKPNSKNIPNGKSEIKFYGNWDQDPKVGDGYGFSLTLGKLVFPKRWRIELERGNVYVDNKWQLGTTIYLKENGNTIYRSSGCADPANGADFTITIMGDTLAVSNYKCGLMREDCSNREIGIKYISEYTGQEYLVVDNDSLRNFVNEHQLSKQYVCTSHVTDLSKLFAGYEFRPHELDNMEQINFVKGMGSWDVSHVEKMDGLFSSFHPFVSRYPFELDLSRWNTANVKNMQEIFSNDPVSANKDIIGYENWNVSNVTNFRNAFLKSRPRLGISKWDVHNATTMSGMFKETDYELPNFGTWDVSKVVDMSRMFEGANDDLIINGLSAWSKHINANNMNFMFAKSNMIADIHDWKTTTVYSYAGFDYEARLANYWYESRRPIFQFGPQAKNNNAVIRVNSKN